LEGLSMKERRGSGLWGETDGLANAVYRFEPGDLVIPVAVQQSDFLGVVKEVCPKINKIMVLWGGGSLKQHDPDEIILHPHQDPIVRSRMGCSRRGSRIVADNAIPSGDQFVGNPDTHGINEPRGGGFSIMQDLQKDLHKEMKQESLDTGPRVASRRGTASFFVAEGGVTADSSLNAGMFGDMPPPNCPHCNGEREWDRPGVARCHFCRKKEHVRKSDDSSLNAVVRKDDWVVVKDKGPYEGDIGQVVQKLGREIRVWFPASKSGDINANVKSWEKADPVKLKKWMDSWQKGKRDEDVHRLQSSDGMKSRRAMYWGAPDRVYRLTKEEQESGSALCPKCQKEMALEPFTKSEKLYTCQKCGFKVPTSKTTTTRITIDVDKQTGEVDVDVTTAKGKGRRGSL
jgi:predicted RNA-binding Zn-ribbon protein involved in translation (DUF1610 family)